MSICQRIFERMGQDNARLRALAASINVAPSTVTSWKSRGSDPPAKYIVAIAAFLGVSPMWLLTGENETISETKSDKYDEYDPPNNITSTAPYQAIPDKDEAHRELTELFDSLDRPGKTLMLAAGYKEQLRLAEARKETAPRICALDKLTPATSCTD
ncbi:MAG: helix-turn-helix domain-containing protein [Anaerovibrio sp.]